MRITTWGFCQFSPKLRSSHDPGKKCCKILCNSLQLPQCLRLRSDMGYDIELILSLHGYHKHWWQVLVPLWFKCGAKIIASLTVQGGQEFHFPHFFFKFWLIFVTVPQTFLIFFLILTLWVGKLPTREGPSYAIVWSSQVRINVAKITCELYICIMEICFIKSVKMNACKALYISIIFKDRHKISLFYSRLFYSCHFTEVCGLSIPLEGLYTLTIKFDTPIKWYEVWKLKGAMKSPFSHKQIQ